MAWQTGQKRVQDTARRRRREHKRLERGDALVRALLGVVRQHARRRLQRLRRLRTKQLPLHCRVQRKHRSAVCEWGGFSSKKKGKGKKKKRENEKKKESLAHTHKERLLLLFLHFFFLRVQE